MYGLIVVPRNGDSAIYLYRRAEDFAEALMGWANRIQMGSWSGELGAFEGSSIPIDADVQMQSTYTLGGFHRPVFTTVPNQKVRNSAINVIDDACGEPEEELEDVFELLRCNREKI